MAAMIDIFRDRLKDIIAVSKPRVSSKMTMSLKPFVMKRFEFDKADVVSNSPKNGIHREISKENSTNEDYANSPAGVKNATSNDAAQVLRNWADCAEDLNPGTDDVFTVVKGRKRRRESVDLPASAARSNGAGTSRRQRPSSQWMPRVQEITNVVQFAKVNGHYLVGLDNKSLAEHLSREGLEIEGTLIRTFPFRKSSTRITVGNLPFFVGYAAIVDALSRYGRITSITPKLLMAGEFTYTDGRREAFILLHDGITIDKLPTRFEIRIKGEAWPAFLSHGIKCSKCHGQGHRRANCPQLHGHSTTSRWASPPSTTNLLPSTAPGLSRQSSAAPPAPAPPSPAVGLSGAPPDARAASLPSTAPLPSTPAPPASSVQVAAPAPPPMAPAPEDPASPRSAATEPTPPARPDFVAPCGPLPAQGTLGLATHTPDVDMTTIEETSASSPAAVIPTPPLPAPQPAGPTPSAPHEEESTPTVKTPSPLLLEQEENMIVEIFRKLKHTTCLKPLYVSGIHPNELKSAILFTDDRVSLMAELSPALKGVLAEFLGAAIELAQNYHPIMGAVLGIGALCSLLLLKRKKCPIAMGLVTGLGMDMSNCWHEIEASASYPKWWHPATKEAVFSYKTQHVQSTCWLLLIFSFRVKVQLQKRKLA
ncbi:MINOS1 [Cordylochernes scorpioides]|uniref:MINOS1 n=1 Tax=Cordylochernes scorpioides TaxID=51811 RepID=A0ABY6L8F3_9ARAC|nr:MINOS1 [Cordylochernes scorpioides]